MAEPVIPASIAVVSDQATLQSATVAVPGNSLQALSYISESTVFQACSVLRQMIAKNVENIKYACFVISSIDTSLAEKLIAEFPLEIQTQIMYEMLSMIQLSTEDIDSFLKNFPKLIQEQFGGRLVLAKIMENLKVEDKIKLTTAIEDKFPEKAYDFRQIVILFEDLFKYGEEEFGKLFGDIPTDVLATAFSRESEDNILRMKDSLPKQVRALVEQGIMAGKLRNSASDINKAQQYIVDRAKDMVENGFLPPLISPQKQKQKDKEKESP